MTHFRRLKLLNIDLEYSLILINLSSSLKWLAAKYKSLRSVINMGHREKQTKRQYLHTDRIDHRIIRRYWTRLNNRQRGKRHQEISKWLYIESFKHVKEMGEKYCTMLKAKHGSSKTQKIWLICWVIRALNGGV